MLERSTNKAAIGRKLMGMIILYLY